MIFMVSSLDRVDFTDTNYYLLAPKVPDTSNIIILFLIFDY